MRMDYDLGPLIKLGKRREKLLAEVKENLRLIGAEIVKARTAGVTQDKLVPAAKVSRVTVQKFEPSADA